MSSDYKFGRCGVFCEMCPIGNGRIKELSAELERLTVDFFKDFPNFDEFDRNEFKKGLKHFQESYICPTCVNIEDPWCMVLKCDKVRELKSCLLCEEFMECPRTEYQRNRYPFVIDHYQRVKEVGFDQHLNEERHRAESGTLLHDIRKY